MKRILIIDDDAEFLLTISKMFKIKGFDVMTCSKASEAIIRLQSIFPDIILCDVMLSDMQGFDFYKTLKRNFAFSNIPLIFISGRAVNTEDIMKGLDLGADDYFLKPIDFEILLKRINARIEKKDKIDEYLNFRMKEIKSMIGNQFDFELKKPFEGIIGKADTIIQNYKNLSKDELFYKIEQIKASSEKLYKSIENILLFISIIKNDFVQLDYFKIHSVNDIDINAIFGSIYGASFRKKDIFIKFNIVSQIRRPILLKKMVQELVDNAIKFSKIGAAITFNLDIDEKRVRLEIRDEGNGFKIASKEQVLPFSTNSDEVDGKSHGLKLGLWIVKMLVENLNGDFEIYSEIGKGSTIIIEYPN